MEKVSHTFLPVFDARSRILILGTMPSVLSRKQNFYYGNPKNRFYDVLCRLLDCRKPETVEQKKTMLLSNRIAVFDVLRECKIAGSSDASIRSARPNDLSPILRGAQIRCVFANGAAAYRYYRRFFDDEVICLPSTSPANAAWSMERLAEAWAVILTYL